MYKLLVILVVFLLGLYFIYYSNDIETFADANAIGTSTSTDLSGNTFGHKKMTNNCPDVLIQKGSALFLYNTNRASVPGVNPIRFENLEEYIEFTEWQRSQGILCPILYLQHAYNVQGEPVYKARPSPTNLQGGLPDYYVNQAILPYINPNIMPGPADAPLNAIVTMPNTFTAAATAATVPVSVQGFGGSAGAPYCDTPLDNLYNSSSNSSNSSNSSSSSSSGPSANPMDDNWGGVDFTEKVVQSGYYKGNEVTK